MKKLIKFFLTIYCVLFIGCNNISNYKDDSLVLPNGYVMSSNELETLKTFGIKKGYIDESGKPKEVNLSEEDINNMVEELNKEFGPIAKNYYGYANYSSEYPLETRQAGSIFKSIESTRGNIELADKYKSDYTAYFKINNFFPWFGPWWFHYAFISGEIICEQKYTTNRFGLVCDSINWTYSDETTSFSGQANNTNRIYIGDGGTKYNWFYPEMDAKITLEIKHPWVENSSVQVSSKIICK